MKDASRAVGKQLEATHLVLRVYFEVQNHARDQGLSRRRLCDMLHNMLANALREEAFRFR